MAEQLTPAEWVALAKILAEQFDIPADDTIRGALWIRYGVDVGIEKAKELADG